MLQGSTENSHEQQESALHQDSTKRATPIQTAHHLADLDQSQLQWAVWSYFKLVFKIL